MTSLALARSWRPKTFSQLVGQDHVVKALTHALDQGRLHHAWLFTGTRGVGKTTIARIMAKALNCFRDNQWINPITEYNMVIKITSFGATVSMDPVIISFISSVPVAACSSTIRDKAMAPA